MKKNIVRIIVAAVSLFVAYKILTFELLPVEIREVSRLKVPNKDYQIGIYCALGNATVQNCVQVRKLQDGHDSLIALIDVYDTVISFELKGDSLLNLEVARRASWKPVYDTVSVRLE